MPYSVYGIYKKNTDELYYIGLTIQSLEKRFYGHCSSDLRIGRYLKKEGCDKFEIRLLHTATSQREMERKEQEMISKYKPLLNVVCNSNADSTLVSEINYKDYYLNSAMWMGKDVFLEPEKKD